MGRSGMSSSMTVAEAGRKGGRARANNLSAHRRKQIARMGYLASPLSTKRAKKQPNEKIAKKISENKSCA